jgi:hypothetical protein
MELEREKENDSENHKDGDLDRDFNKQKEIKIDYPSKNNNKIISKYFIPFSFPFFFFHIYK